MRTTTIVRCGASFDGRRLANSDPRQAFGFPPPARRRCGLAAGNRRRSARGWKRPRVERLHILEENGIVAERAFRSAKRMHIVVFVAALVSQSEAVLFCFRCLEHWLAMPFSGFSNRVPRCGRRLTKQKET